MKCSEVEINEMYEAKSHDSEVPLNKIPKTTLYKWISRYEKKIRHTKN